MKRIRAGMAATLLGVTLAGCQLYWTKPNVTLEEFQRDHAGCVRAVGVSVDGNPNGVFVRDDVYKACLTQRGWQRVQDGNLYTEPGRFRGLEDDQFVRFEDPLPPQIPWTNDPSLAGRRK